MRTATDATTRLVISIRQACLEFSPTGNAGGAAGLGEGFAGSVEGGAGFTTSNNPSAPIDYGTYGTYGYLGGGPYGSATVQGISGMNNNTTLGLAGAQGLLRWSPMRHVFRS
jgi:hypothetical protein